MEWSPVKPSLIVLPLLPMLGGCVAAPVGAMMAASYGLTAGTVGLTAYQLNEVTRDGRLSFESQRTEVSPADQGVIRQAGTLALIPNFGTDNGRVHDVFSQRSDVRLVSMSAVTTGMERARGRARDGNELASLTSLPRQEKIEALVRVGSASNAQLVLLIEPGGHRTRVSFLGAPSAEAYFDATLVSTRDRRVVWTERATLRMNGINNSESAMMPLLARGFAERLTEIRRGVTQPPAGT